MKDFTVEELNVMSDKIIATIMKSYDYDASKIDNIIPKIYAAMDACTDNPDNPDLFFAVIGLIYNKNKVTLKIYDQFMTEICDQPAIIDYEKQFESIFGIPLPKNPLSRIILNFLLV